MSAAMSHSPQAMPAQAIPDRSQSHLVTPRQARAGNIVASAGTSDSAAGSVSLTGGATSASASGGAITLTTGASSATSSGDAVIQAVMLERLVSVALCASQHRCIDGWCKRQHCVVDICIRVWSRRRHHRGRRRW